MAARNLRAQRPPAIVNAVVTGVDPCIEPDQVVAALRHDHAVVVRCVGAECRLARRVYGFIVAQIRQVVSKRRTSYPTAG